MKDQDKLFVDFSTSIPKDDPNHHKRAIEAANRRKKRVGQYALGTRGKGFGKAIKNLWIPYSGSENTAVIHTPEPKIVREKYATERRVIEKYAETDVSQKAVKNWARFASMNTEREMRVKFRGYLSNANEQLSHLSDALEDADRTYTFRSIKGSELAIGGISRYLISLKSFSGLDENNNLLVKRRWIQDRWTTVMKEEKEEAVTCTNNINERNSQEQGEEDDDDGMVGDSSTSTHNISSSTGSNSNNVLISLSSFALVVSLCTHCSTFLFNHCKTYHH